MNTIDFDKFGHCVKCHENMIYSQVVDGGIQRRISSNYREVEYLLNDGSRMRVAICKNCEKTLNDSDYKKIMDCVIKGWDVDTDRLVNDPNKKLWDCDKKDRYMKYANNLDIVCTSSGLGDDVLQKKLDSFEKVGQ